MRCPDCHATNPDGASFCGQCHRRFDPTPASSATPRTGDQASAHDHAAHAAHGNAAHDQAAPTGDTSPATPTLRQASVGRFAAADGELTWRCAVCDSTQPLTTFTCTVCGARMDAEAGGDDDVDWDDARRAEVLVPGLGHIRAGHGGMGISRTAITAIWLLGFIALALGGGAVAGLPLLIGIAITWATGPGDLDAARAGRSPRLNPQRFMYLVIAVTVGVIVAGGLSIAL